MQKCILQNQMRKVQRDIRWLCLSTEATFPWCSSYQKGSLCVTLDYGRQLYLYGGVSNHQKISKIMYKSIFIKVTNVANELKRRRFIDPRQKFHRIKPILNVALLHHHTYTRSHAHRGNAGTHIHPHPQKKTHTLTNKHTHTHRHTHSLSLSLSLTLSLSHTHTHIYIYIYIYVYIIIIIIMSCR